MNKQVKKGSLKRVFKLLFKYYPVLIPLTIACIVFSAIVAAIPDIFIQKIISIINKFQEDGIYDWNIVKKEVVPNMILLISIYVLSLCSVVAYTQLMAYITQDFLYKLRKQMFDGMQDLPIKYFDQTKYGDIMSYYTNDIDALRQLISEAVPGLIRSATIIIAVFGIMLWYSIYLTLIIVVGIVALLLVSKKMAGGSTKYFVAMQKDIAINEGYIQEFMNGLKVVKVFNYEEKACNKYDELNEALYKKSYKANSYANMLGPINMNIGNVLYVIIALVGGILLATNVRNISISGMAFEISIVVVFLNMTRQFTGNVNNVSQQVSPIVMAVAGANRIFDLIDTKKEEDEGYVTLVNCKEDDNGNIIEVNESTNNWAWKHPHGDGTVSYTKLQGDIKMFDVDFEYVSGKPVLQNISLYAKPGQKVAFVGATGAGKTTITNLINRFYDIADGKIRYDDININKISKKDLRRSLGIVLQDTNLFTGTVMENIRYGKLEASDDECIAAAKLSGADTFITRLPDGYNTMLVNNGSNLSQGQRQLLAIARAAVANPPVMILDEATSSIDTHTEAIVSKGMDELMKGRTVFVIAHRLSTVKNADVIMVLDHGKIIERGTHQQLIDQKGVYYQLYTGSFELE